MPGVSRPNTEPDGGDGRKKRLCGDGEARRPGGSSHWTEHPRGLPSGPGGGRRDREEGCGSGQQPHRSLTGGCPGPLVGVITAHPCDTQHAGGGGFLSFSSSCPGCPCVRPRGPQHESAPSLLGPAPQPAQPCVLLHCPCRVPPTFPTPRAPRGHENGPHVLTGVRQRALWDSPARSSDSSVLLGTWGLLSSRGPPQL